MAVLDRRNAALAVGLVAQGFFLFAEKLDSDSRKWLESMTPIILPQEARDYAQLKDRTERAEFERIFWARRDEDLRTPENETRETLTARIGEADRRFAVVGKAGSATGCGRLFVLLGEPDAVRDDAMGVVVGSPVNRVRGGAERSSANEFTRLPDRQPQVWVYRNRREITFAGGEARVAVDGRCAVVPGVNANLDRLAARRVVNPGLAYRITGGRVTRLADLMPRPTPAQELLGSGRKDFDIAVQPAFVRADGATAVIALVRAQAAGLVGADGAGKTLVSVTIAAHAVDETGQVAAVDERPLAIAPDEQGRLIASFRLFLRPGRYTLRFALLDAKVSKGAVSSQPIEVPDLGGPGPSVGTLFVVKDVAEGAEAKAADAKASDALDAFVLGSLKLAPRFANVFAQGEAAHFVYGVNGSVDETTGKADLRVHLALLAGPRVVAETPTQSFADPHVFTAVGPVDLAFPPGAYTARLSVKDRVAGKDLVTEASFTIR